ARGDREPALLRRTRAPRSPSRGVRLPAARRARGPRAGCGRLARLRGHVHATTPIRASGAARGTGDALSEGQRDDLLAVGVLALLVVLLFHSVLFLGRVFYERDVSSFFIPMDALLKRTLSEGHWPLWNRYAAFGQPMLANPQFATFYPFTWLLLVASPATYYTLFVVAHCLFSALGAYALLRTIGVTRVAGVMGAAVWIVSGPWLSLASNQTHLAGVAWMPWVLLAAERSVRRPTPGRVIAWALATGLQLLAGSLEMCLLAGIAAAGRCAVAIVAAPDGRARRR